MHRLRFGLLIAALLPAAAIAQPGPQAPPPPPAAAPKQAPSAPKAAPAPKTPASAAPVPAAPARLPLAESLTGDAKGDYEAGRLLFGDTDYTGARVKFLHAYDLSKDPRLLWNVAACDKNLRRYARVEHFVERYVKEGGDTLTEAEKNEANALLDTVRAFISTVTLKGGEPGSQVFVDDEPMGELPLAAPLRVELGRRRVRVSKEGFKDFERVEVFDGRSEVPMEVTQAPIVHEAKLSIDAPTGAAILIDGRPVGTGHFEGKLASGAHRIRVTADGQRPHESDLTLRDDEVRSLAITLQPLTVEDGPLVWPWIVAGSALAAGGLAVGGYFLFKEDFEPVGGTITSVDLRATWSF